MKNLIIIVSVLLMICFSKVVAQPIKVWEKKGDSLMLSFQLEQARRAFQNANQIQASPNLWYKIAKTYNIDTRDENQKASILLHKILQSERKDTLLLAKTYTLLGDIFRHKALYDSAKLYSGKGILLGRKYNYIYPIRAMGRVYINTGDMAKASQYIYEALQKAEKSHDESIIPFIYLDLGTIYQAMNKFKEADNYLFKAIKLEERKPYSEVLGMLYEAIATQYADESSSKNDKSLTLKAISFFQKGYEASLRTQDTQGTAFHLMNMAKRFAFLGKVGQAKKLFRQSETMFYKLNYPDKTAAFYVTYGDFLYSYGGDKKQGLALIEKAANLWEVNKNRANQIIAFEALSNCYEQLGNYKKALFFSHKFRELDKAMSGESAQKQLQELNLKYDTEKKDAQLAEQKLEILEKKQRITQIILFTIIVVLILLVAFTIYRSQQQRKLKQLESTFEQAAQQLKSFNYSVSHDLRHPIVIAQHALDNLKKAHLSSSYQIEQVEKAMQSLNNMNEIIEAMLTLSAIEREELNPRLVNTTELVNDIIEGFETDHLIHFSELPNVVADIRLLRQVFTNLISNAIKYSQNNQSTPIEIIGQTTSEGVFFEVKDSGVGFDERYSSKLFNLFGRLHTEFNGIGIGLVIVKKIIEKHGGNVWAKGKINKGATFGFKIPQTSFA